MRKIGEKILPLTVTAVCLAVMLAYGTSPMEGGNALTKASVHNFVHANWAHLAVNAISLWLVNPKTAVFLRGIVGGTIAWLICAPLMSATPVGLSDALFCIVGFTVSSGGGRWWRTKWFATVAAVLLLTCIIPGISGLTHAVSLAGGLVWGTAVSFTRKISSDYDKAGGNRRNSGRKRQTLQDTPGGA